MKNKNPSTKVTRLIARVVTDNQGRTRLHYTLPGLLLKTQIIENLISQHSKN